VWVMTKSSGASKKEGKQRQLDIQEEQLDRVLQQEVGVGNRAGATPRQNTTNRYESHNPPLSAAVSSTDFRNASRSAALAAIGGSGAAGCASVGRGSFAPSSGHLFQITIRSTSSRLTSSRRRS
jgi:hypothetical protein